MSRPSFVSLTTDERNALVELLKTGISASEAARQFGCNRKTAAKLARKLKAGTAPVTETVSADPVEVSRLRTQLAAARSDLANLTHRVRKAEDIRSGVLGVLSDPPPPPLRFTTTHNGPAAPETVILFLSDLHWGEKIRLEAMDGLNSYDIQIARNRLKRYFQTIVELMTKHWVGPPPARLILILGGDLISGEIHLELAKTNEAQALPAVRDLATHLTDGLIFAKRHLPCEIDVISIAGNHGRVPLKPESKDYAENSYDTLVSDFLDMGLRNVEGINFYVPPSPDALFSVYGWHFLATHGNNIGSRGGQGFIGPSATAARGMKRVCMDYAARGVHLDFVLIGHLHTPLQLEEGFVNGCLGGPSEYSRDGRFRPSPARQLFLTIHPRRGLTMTRWINVGAPEEGALYNPPPMDRDIRPRWRMPQVSPNQTDLDV